MGFVIYLVALTVHSLGWPMTAVILGVGLVTIAYTRGRPGGGDLGRRDPGRDPLDRDRAQPGLPPLPAPGGPAAGLRLAWSAHKFSLGAFSWDPALKSAGVMIVYGLCWYLQRYTVDQTIIQRYLVARSDRDAIRGVGFGALLCVPVWALFLLIGTLTWAYYRMTGEALPASIAKADQVYPYFLSTHLPAVFVGMILAALFSAAMSGLASDLNSLASVPGVQDLYAKLRPGATDRQSLAAGKGFVVLAGGLCTATAWALAHTQGAALPLYFLASSVLAGGLLGIFVLAFFTRRANRTGVFLGIAACLAFTVYATLTSGPDRWPDLGSRNFAWNSLTIGAIGHLLVIGVGYPASFLSRKRGRADPGLTLWGNRTGA